MALRRCSAFAGHAGLDGFGGLLFREFFKETDVKPLADFIMLKVPFYCCAWANIGSARTAIRSGFRPAWVEMTVKSLEYVNDMNK